MISLSLGFRRGTCPEARVPGRLSLLPQDDPKKSSDIEPELEPAETDEEPSLPESEDISESILPTLARWRPAAPPSCASPSSRRRSPGVYRMIDAARRRALCRQGEEHQEAHRRLCAADRLRHPHRAHDRGDQRHRVRLDPHRDRGAAARSQPDQAAAAALQRAAARRQVVSLYPHHRRPLGAADPQASRRAHAAGQLLRPVRLGVGGQPHHHGAAARLPAALLLRRGSSRAAPGRACCTRSSAARRPAPARSISPNTPSWCARRRRSSPAAARR